MPTTLYKPAGLPVFSPHRDPTGDCLLRHLLARQPWRGKLDWPAGFEAGIAHRLDNATSGAILAADDPAELVKLRHWFTEHRLLKTYRLLAARDVPWNRHVCDKPLAHHRTKKQIMIVQRGRDTSHRGKWYPARTEFKRLQDRLFQVTMRGGIMHQIRAHAAFLGIPILGDHRYGGTRRDHDQMPAFFLHHQGMTGPDGFHTANVPLPRWAMTDAERDSAHAEDVHAPRIESAKPLGESEDAND